MNGSVGLAAKYDAAAGRYAVKLKVGGNAKATFFKLKPLNLRAHGPDQRKRNGSEGAGQSGGAAAVAATASEGPSATTSTAAEEEVKGVSRMMSSLVPRWVEPVRASDPDRWLAMVHAAASKVLSAPEDPTPVQLLSGLAAHGLLRCDEARALAVVAVRAMGGQAPLSAKLLDDDSKTVSGV